MDYLATSIAKTVKEKIEVKALSELHMENHGATYEIEVRNNGDVELPGDAYAVTATLWACNFDTMDFDPTDEVKQFTGNDVPAHGKTVYKIPGDVDFEYNYWEVDFDLKMSKEQMLATFLQAKGDEYSKYLENKDALNSLKLQLNGTIGVSLDGKMNYDGLLDEGEASFSLSGTKVVRKLKLGSYDVSTNKLVMKEYDLRDTYLGDFVGTWKNGTYKGIFTNTKGGKVDFNLKE